MKSQYSTVIELVRLGEITVTWSNLSFPVRVFLEHMAQDWFQRVSFWKISSERDLVFHELGLPFYVMIFSVISEPKWKIFNITGSVFQIFQRVCHLLILPLISRPSENWFWFWSQGKPTMHWGTWITPLIKPEGTGNGSIRRNCGVDWKGECLFPHGPLGHPTVGLEWIGVFLLTFHPLPMGQWNLDSRVAAAALNQVMDKQPAVSALPSGNHSSLQVPSY